MTEPMLLAAEEIIKIIDDEIRWIRADIEDQGAQLAATYDLSESMSNYQYIGLLRAIEGQQCLHNQIIHLVSLKHHIEAAEEEKRHREMKQ